MVKNRPIRGPGGVGKRGNGSGEGRSSAWTCVPHKETILRYIDKLYIHIDTGYVMWADEGSRSVEWDDAISEWPRGQNLSIMTVHMCLHVKRVKTYVHVRVRTAVLCRKSLGGAFTRLRRSSPAVWGGGATISIYVGN